jgi:hypothetical protein
MNLSKMTYLEILEYNVNEQSSLIDELKDHRDELLKVIEDYKEFLKIAEIERDASRNLIAAQRDLIKALEEKIKNGNL